MRVHLLASAAAISCFFAAVPAMAQAKQINIQARDAEKALMELGRQANIQVMTESGTVRGRQLNPISGKYTPAEALKKMIAGSDLVVRQVAANVFSVMPEQKAYQDAPTNERTAPGSRATGVEEKSLDSGDTEQSSSEDIVVTGTLIKGIAPVGTNVIGLSTKTITQSGATNAQQLLAQVPQVSNFFNGTPAPNGDFTFPGATPVIRNLPGINSTLTLLNGRRLVNLGVIQAAGDPGALPVSVMERVEVVPDGGSATYGSDAVGGTINFIPRRRFDGVQFDGSYGFADDYSQKYLSGLAGKDWGSGSAYVAYAFNRNDAIFGRDRGYVSQYRASKGGNDFRSANCALPNAIVNGISYAGPDFTAGQNRCDTSDDTSIFPEQTRHSVFAFLTQDLTPNLRFENQVYFSGFKSTAYRDQVSTTVTIDSSNPYFRTVGTGDIQTVQFAYDPAWGSTRTTRTKTTQWGLSPKFTLKLPQSWQIEMGGNYGRGYVQFNAQTLNAVAQSEAVAATDPALALNPYNIAATNPDVLARIHDYESYATSKTELAEARIVASGALATIAGGDIRLALGSEYHHESMGVRNTQAPVGEGQKSQLFVGKRNVVSAFGELVIPIIGSENAFTGAQKLTLSGAARYDHYDDVGDTINPKVGVTWMPFNALTIRGNYGTSFNAPQLGDTTAAADTRAQVFNTWGNLDPNASLSDAQRRTVLIAGGNVNLKPQTADTFSIGADLRPAMAPGLTISATYYAIKFKNLISITPVFDRNIFLPAFAKYITINPTLEQARQLLAGFRLDGIASVEDLYANGQSPYMIADARRYNLGIQKTQGIDYNVAYDRDTNFGSINLSVAGSYTLVRSDQPFADGPSSSAFDAGAPRLTLMATAGATIGKFSGQVQYSRTNGYDLGGYQYQTRVGAFDPVNVFASYDFGEAGLLKGTLISVTIQNLFDKNPPFYNGGSGYTNGSTYGRLVVLGLRKKF